MIFWYDRLYVGKGAEPRKKKIIEQIEKGSFVPGAYLISLPEYPSSLIDIFPACLMLQPHYRNAKVKVLGLALGKAEAVALTEQLLMECYRQREDFAISDWIFTEGSFQKGEKVRFR